jgi:hypothetical protein
MRHFKTTDMKIISIGLILILTACSAQKRTEVPETRLSIIPPDGFVVSPGFNGLQNDKKEGIEVQDLTGNYYILKGQYSAEQLERKGLKVLNTEPVKIQKYNGFVHHLRIDKEAEAYSLIFGDSTFCAVLLGSYRSSNGTAGKKMKEALMTAKYDKNKTPPSLNSEIFLDDKQSRFKLATASSNYMIYSLNGEAKSDYGMDPYLRVHEVPFDKNETPESMANIIIGGLGNAGFSNIRILNVSSEDLQNFKSYEFEVSCTVGEVSTSIYNVVLKNDKRAITVQGGCFGDCEKTISEFKTLAHSITVRD